MPKDLEVILVDHFAADGRMVVSGDDVAGIQSALG